MKRLYNFIALYSRLPLTLFVNGQSKSNRTFTKTPH